MYRKEILEGGGVRNVPSWDLDAAFTKNGECPHLPRLLPTISDCSTGGKVEKNLGKCRKMSELFSANSKVIKMSHNVGNC